MTYEQLVEMIDGWLDQVRLRIRDRGMHLRFEKRDDPECPERGQLTFCTVAHTYSINFHTGYLGCGASCRTTRPGETWLRGSDLPDGKFTRETWDAIMLAIVGYELVALVPTQEETAPTPVDAQVS